MSTPILPPISKPPISQDVSLHDILFGPPMDPLPLPFQLQAPEKLKQEFVKAGLKTVRVEQTSEKMEFSSNANITYYAVKNQLIA